MRLSVKALESLLLAVTLQSGSALAAEWDITGVFHFLDNRSANSANISSGLRQQFGADVIPNGTSGTTGTATQGSFVDLELNFTPLDVNPNQFVRSLPANLAPDGAWTLNFTNAGNSTSVTTPSIAGATAMPFVSAMKISGSGAKPTFTWELPTGAPIDAVRVRIRNITQRVGTGGIDGDGVGNTIYTQAFLGASTNSFTVDPADPGFTQPLQLGQQYSIEVQLRDLRNANGGTGGRNTLSQSRSFFDFTLLSDNAPADVYLPMVNTEGGASPIYQFQPISVRAGEKIFIDPLVATGFDYDIGLGGQNFASVLLPTGIGDDRFEILVWDGGAFVPLVTVNGGQEYFFGLGGVSRFRVTGIETSAAIDPLNATAFVTGLSFVGDGSFAGTMTPIVVNAVPEPRAYALMLAGLGIVACASRRRKHSGSRYDFYPSITATT